MRMSPWPSIKLDANVRVAVIQGTVNVKNNKNCGPGCRCICCGNGPSINTTDSNVVHCLDDDGDTDELYCLEVQGILNESSDESYTDKSDDDTDQFQNDLDIYERDVESIMANGDDDDKL